jgi:hypothetical protein
MGTYWIASELNKHPEIFCTHSYYHPITEASDETLPLFLTEKHRNLLKTRFSHLKLNDFLLEHRLATNKPFIGNSHAYTIDDALIQIKEQKLKNIKLVHLVRHPITRINSAISCFKKEWFEYGFIDHMSFTVKNYHTWGRPILKKNFMEMLEIVDNRLDYQFFITAVLQEVSSAHQTNTANNHSIPIIRYEELTSSVSTMTDLMNHIYINDSVANKRWIEESVAFNTKINAHSIKTPTNAIRQFAEWEDWQQAFYLQIINQHADFNSYAALYDILPTHAHNAVISPA